MKKLLLTMLLTFSVFSIAILAKNLKVVAAYGNKEKIFQEFTKETGIKVEFLDLSSGEVLSRIQAEGEKPSADIWFGGGIDSFIAAKDRNILEKYESKEAKYVNPEYRDLNGYWSGVSLVLVGFMANNELLKEKNLPTPKVWKDLTNPLYKDEVMMANPAISGTNYAMVNGIIQGMGEKDAWSYFKGLNKNVPFLAKRGGEPPKKVAAGEFALAVIPMSGEFISMEGKYPVTTIYPEDMIPWVPAGMAIFKNAENLEKAAQDLGAPKIRVISDIMFPLVKPAFMVAFVNGFTTTMTTTGAIIFLISPGASVATVEMFNTIRDGDYGLASIIAIFIIIVTFLINIVAIKFIEK